MEISSHDIMFSTTQIDKLLGALAKAQGEFKIPKKSHDGFHGKYANLQDINTATQEALSKNGLSITQAHDQSTIKSLLGRKILLMFTGISARVNAVLDTHPALTLPTNSCLTRIPNPIANRMLRIIVK